MRNQRAFTLIELMIVIAIIGILAAMAVPAMTSYRLRGYNAAAKADLKNAYTASQAFFAENPSGTATVDLLGNYGYTATENINLSITEGERINLSMRSYHQTGSITYTVDADGTISP